MTLIILCIALALVVLLHMLFCWIAGPEENECFKKEIEIMTRYRIQVICNDVILARTLEGDNHSDIFDKAVKYSFEEADGLPDLITIKKDVIYL